ncbi:MAG: hypothetical protein C0601_12205 [Candidatus Muiribacterium halophilum]|uniref:carboxypeptidase T n=1 Tax=Muiribacterium halophilum TaxID=2053465 RepID=A0A2N5ZAL8_MUIH1|nr:MAG: hypothetical protein C0601_12205 [Candidatus Muirbacterium halophilum]
MKKIFILTLVTIISLSVFASDLMFIRIDDLTKSDINILASSGSEIVDVRNGNSVDIIVRKDFYNILKNAYQTTVLLKDMDSIYSRYIGKAISEDSVYHTYDEMVVFMKEISKDHSDIVCMRSIGKSWEDRDIWALVISDNPGVDEDEPTAAFWGAHHSREWISIEVPIAIAQYLIENYDKDLEVKKIVDNNEIWVVPMVNPDGVEYSMKEYSYWRKNRRHITGNTYGIDPNRNYGYHWGESGASSSAWSDTYKGEEAFSEKETQAVRDIAAKKKFAVSISYHSYGGDILFPWSYTDKEKCKDHDQLKMIADKMNKYVNYSVMQSGDLYPAAGDSDDWLYSQHRTFAFTFELGRSFIPSDELVDGICEKNVKAAMELLSDIPEILSLK